MYLEATDGIHGKREKMAHIKWSPDSTKYSILSTCLSLVALGPKSYRAAIAGNGTFDWIRPVGFGLYFDEPEKKLWPL